MRLDRKFVGGPLDGKTLSVDERDLEIIQIISPGILSMQLRDIRRNSLAYVTAKAPSDEELMSDRPDILLLVYRLETDERGEQYFALSRGSTEELIARGMENSGNPWSRPLAQMKLN